MDGSSGSSSTSASAKRERTEAQLAQKRRMDRVKQKNNRAEQKNRLENIEKDVTFLRETIQDLVGTLRSNGGQDPNPPSSQPDKQVQLSRSSSPRVSPQVAVDFLHQQPMNGLFPYVTNNCFDSSGTPDTISSSSFSLTTGQLQLPQPTALSLLPQVECICGVQHAVRTDCLEYASFTILYQAHLALAQNPRLAIRIPPNPTLANLLLHSVSDSPLTMFLGFSLRQFQVANAETMFGLYYLSYRLLRWRLYPNVDTLRDVPEFMRLTSVQTAIPHPLCGDFLPWPKLRDHLIQNQHTDSRHSVSLYMQSLRLDWPEDQMLLCRGSLGDYILNPAFEAHALDLRNWSLGTPWKGMFPHLDKFIVP